MTLRPPCVESHRKDYLILTSLNSRAKKLHWRYSFEIYQRGTSEKDIRSTKRKQFPSWFLRLILVIDLMKSVSKIILLFTNLLKHVHWRLQNCEYFERRT